MMTSPEPGACQQEVEDDPMFVIKNLDTGLEMRIDDFDKLANIATAERQEQEHAEKKAGIKFKGTKAIKNWTTATTKKASAAAKKAVSGIKDAAHELRHELHVPTVLGKQKPGHGLDSNLSKASTGSSCQQSSNSELSSAAMTRSTRVDSSPGPLSAETSQSASSLVSAAVSEPTPSSKQLLTLVPAVVVVDSQVAHAGQPATDPVHKRPVSAVVVSSQPASSSSAAPGTAAAGTPAALTVPSGPAVPSVARLVSHKRASTAVHEVVLAQVLEGSCGVVWAVAFSKDGSFLATAGQDGVLRIWQLTSSREQEQRRNWVYFVPKSSKVVDDNGCNHQQPQHSLQHPQEQNAPGCAEPQQSETTAEDRASTLIAPDKAVPASAQVDTSASQQSEHLQEHVQDDVQLAQEPPPPEPQQQLQQQHVVSDEPPAVEFGPYFSVKPVRVYMGHSEDILDVSWSAAGFVLTASLDKSVRLWHVSQPDCLREFWHTDFVTSVQFHPLDAQRFVSGSIDGKIRVWSVTESCVVATAQLHQDMVTAVAFSLNGGRVVAGTMRGRCRFYELAEGKLEYVAQVDVRNQRGAHANGKKVTGICAIPGQLQQFLITTNDSRLRLLEGYGQVLKFKGHRNMVTQVRANLSADGAQVVCGSDDGWVYMWHVNAADAGTTAEKVVQRQHRGQGTAHQQQQWSTGKNAIYQAYLAHDTGVPVTSVAFAPASACGRISVLANTGDAGAVVASGVAINADASAMNDDTVVVMAPSAAVRMKVQHLLVSGGFDGALRVHELI